MVGGFDFASLRNQTLASGNDEEAVTVNTRALIDKVLARYSGEWTTLRELLQNAADAQASTVKIRFETLPSAQVALSNTTDQSEMLKHILLNHTLSRLVVQNDGQPFGENDWTRLKRIAEGNPDETKIGAFGVGFYSVFADCEDPFVSSANQAMAFYWKGNSLFTRRLQLPEGKGSKDTNFVLDYRNKDTPVPSLSSLAQFLATSLTFVALQNIELYLDDWKIITLQKKVAPSQEVAISRDVETRTREKHMKVQRVENENVQMDAIFMNVVGWKPTPSATPSRSSNFQPSYATPRASAFSLQSFFSKLTDTNLSSAKQKAAQEDKALQDAVLEDLTALSTAHVFLRVTTARIETFLSKEFAAELERATKKPPPKTTRLAILTSSYDHATVSESMSVGVAKSIDIFSSVLPGKDHGGRVFIGFPTQQTTGAGFHISAPSVIPTVERESIDLNARFVSTWNYEMLRVAGILSRLAFVSEMTELGDKLKRASQSAGSSTKISKELITKFLPEAAHTLNSFSFKDSTPSYKVGQCVEEAFWTTYKKPLIEIYSSRGVLLNRDVRLATEDLSGFVDGIPVVPDELVNISFVQKLKVYRLLEEITIADVKKELETKALSAEQLVSFIAWAGKKAITGIIDPPTIHSLLEVAVATIPGESGVSASQVIVLGNITTYLNAGKIPPELPVPPDTIPFQFSKSAPVNELRVLGWEPLEIVPWLRYLVESSGGRNGLTPQQDITKSPAFAAQILLVLSKQYDSLSSSSKGTVVQLLEDKTVMPTKLGMRKPVESYFSSVKLFDDLPTISGCPGVKEKFLSTLGVRKTVDLEVIFTRLLTPSEDSSMKWSHVDLIKYLSGVQNDIPARDIQRLKSTPICPAESGLGDGKGTSRLFKVTELFEPKNDLRGLQLPTLYWSDSKRAYSSNSPEGKFLASLGLRSHPSVPELIDLMAATDLVLRNKAMNFFIVNHQLNGYFKFEVGASTKSFLPVEGDPKKLVVPAKCFVDEKSAVFGFDILRSDLHDHASKFGISRDPPINECILRLITNKIPQDTSEARIRFSYFNRRSNEITPAGIAKLSDALIVPVLPNSFMSEKTSHQNFKYISPKSCFLGTSSTYREIFDFVEFGNEANAFLLKCGAKHEPTKVEIANMMVTNPAHLLGIFQSSDKYLGLLRNLADGFADLKKADRNLYKQMKTAPWLLATKEISAKPHKGERQHLLDVQEIGNGDADEDSSIKQWTLASPSQVVIVDDIVSYNLFRTSVLCAPQEDLLEELYVGLGVPLLSSLVDEQMRIGPPVEKHAAATKLHNLILERTKIFLHDQQPTMTKHDSKWLEKNLKVQVTKNITLTRVLRGTRSSNTESRTAAVQYDSTRSAWILFVTSSYDWFQVSQALMPLLIHRPKAHSIMMLEMLLSSDLLRLKARGYNVDRILRAKAAEARVAELQRQREIEAEQQQIREQEAQWAKNHAAETKESSEKELSMPGAFGGDSPEWATKTTRNHLKPGGMFSQLTRRLGLDRASDTAESSGTDESMSRSRGTDGSGMSNGSVGSGGGTGEKPEGTKTVTSPHALHQNLVQAVQSSQAFDSNSVFSPPTTNTVQEITTYCDNTPSQNLTYVADCGGMRIFIHKDLSISGGEFLSANAASLNKFAGILIQVAEVYNLHRKAMHIFMDENTGCIAFNLNGSLFCNLRFFDQLHPDDRSEALIYWFVTVAHELAHNLVKAHDSQHSFYTESFIQQYAKKAMAVFFGGDASSAAAAAKPRIGPM